MTDRYADTAIAELDASGLSAGPRPGVRRRALAVALAAGSLAAPFTSGTGGAVAILLAGALAAVSLTADDSRASMRLPTLGWLPAGVALVILATTAVGLLGSWTATGFWSTQGSAIATWGAVVLAPLLVALLRGGRVRIAPNRPTAILSSVPFVLAVLVTAAQPFEVVARVANRGTDFARHVFMVLESAREGMLDYGTSVYPRSAHSALGLVQAASGDDSYTWAWEATTGLALVFLALVCTGAALLASRVADPFLGAGPWASWVSPAAAVIAVLAGPWVTGFLVGGFVTSLEAGLVLVAAALLFFDGRATPTPSAAFTAIALCALMAHTWQLLLPLIALPALRLTLPLMRSRRLGVGLVAFATVAWIIALPAIAVAIKAVGIGHAATPGTTFSPDPGLRWLLLFVAAAAAALLLRRSAATLPAQSLMLLLIGLGATLVLLLPFHTDGAPSYYFVKTAWTPYPVLVALAIPLMMVLASRVRPGALRIGVVACLSVAALLWTTQHLQQSASVFTGGRGMPAVAIPMAEHLDRQFPPGDARPEVVVWGLLPFLDEGSTMDSASEDLAVVGHVDRVALEALDFGGFPLPAEDLRDSLTQHDPVGVCRYLASSPEVVRVTGPYAAGPLQWLIDSGCPLDVIRPGDWISIRYSAAWFAGTSYEHAPFGAPYLTWAQSEETN